VIVIEAPNSCRPALWPGPVTSQVDQIISDGMEMSSRGTVVLYVQ
jgi:hypothetical protein